MTCKVVYSNANSSNTFLASRRHAKYAALCIKPTELRNSVLVNKCVQCQILQRPGCQEQEQEAGLCTCRPWTGCSAPLSTKPATTADSHSATIRRQLYLFKLLLFYSYVFRPHHDKTMFKLRRCKTQNLPSKMAALPKMPTVTLTGVLTTLGDKTTPKVPFKTAAMPSGNVPLCSSNTMVP